MEKDLFIQLVVQGLFGDEHVLDVAFVQAR
jgi:hypothetical protein